MSTILDQFLVPISESHRINELRYDRNHGKDEAKSTTKLRPVHGFLAHQVHSRLREISSEDNLHIRSLGFPFQFGPASKPFLRGREMQFDCGGDNQKRPDISVTTRTIVPGSRPEKYAYHPFAGLFYKGGNTSVGKNLNNSFESIVGQTSTLRNAGFPVGWVYVMDHHPPVYTRKVTGSLTYVKSEKFEAGELRRYIDLLHQDPEHHANRPDALCVLVVDYDKDSNATLASPESLGFNSAAEKRAYGSLCNLKGCILSFVSKCREFNRR